MNHLEDLYGMYDAAIKKKTAMLNSDDLENPQCAELMDLWTHTLKSLRTVIAMDEAEGEGSYGGNGNYGNYREGNSGGNGGGYSRDYMRSGYSEGGYSARGRGRNARRNSMGRYAAGDEEYIQKLEKLMEEAPNDQMRQSIQRALEEAQRM